MQGLARLTKAYRSLSPPKRAIFWFMGCNVVQKGMGVLTLPLFTRLVSEEEYGRYAVFQSWYTILLLVVSLNLFAGVMNRGLIKYKTDRWGFLSCMQGLSTTSTIFFWLVYLCAIPFWNGILEMRTAAVLLLFLQFLFVPSYLYWAAKQRYEYRYRGLLLSTVLSAILCPVFSLLFVCHWTDKGLALIAGNALTQAGMGAIFYLYLAQRGKRFFDKDQWSYALRFNLPLLPHYLSQMLLIQMDRIMIQKMVGAGQAAIYSVTYTVSLLASLITNAMITAFIPALYADLEERQVVSVQKSSLQLVERVGGVTIVSMFCAPELLTLLAVGGYSEAKWAIPPIAMSVYFNAVASIFVNIGFYFEKTQYTMYVTMLGAGINFVLNLFCIRQFGYMAAGYTTAVCYLLFAVGHTLLYRWYMRQRKAAEQFVEEKKIFSFSLYMVLVMGGCIALYPFVWVRYAVLLLLTALFVWKYRLEVVIK